MKNKKLLFAAGGLALLCVLMVLVCVLFSNEETDEFIGAAPTALPTESWTESAVSTTAEPTPSPTPQVTPDPMQDYPKTLEETSSTVVIEFTPTDTPTLAPMPTPKSQPDYSDNYYEESTGGGNEDYGESTDNGAQYIPGFGWAYPGEAVGEDIDNNGDPNKQVGEM